MNVKEPHIVTGMSRDFAVSQQNPNLVYDAHNIRITTRDDSNSLMSITNERGTRNVPTTGSYILGTTIGDAVLDNYLVIFTHEENIVSNPDHIYKCDIEEGTATITTIFEGNAGFDIKYPLETLPVFESESIQKVYWVDGKNQPRCINIMVGTTITDSNLLEFSPSVTLTQQLSITKSASGGEFPVGTIQYAFSYFKLNGQETRLIDISPLYYLSPRNKGLDATSTSSASFNIVITGVDPSFDKVRVYSIVRTQENGTPNCRIVGDYSIQELSSNVYGIDIIDNGVGGSTINASSLYFIGGEKIVASTLAQKDNTLFLGDIKLEMPNLKEVKELMSTPDTDTTIVSNISVGYDNVSDYNVSPIKAFKYYGYEPDNNRSSYFMKVFKYREKYKLGFIAQYENGQWSEPLNIGIETNEIIPFADEYNYVRGGFSVEFQSNILNKLKELGFKRIAPVVVYPRAIGRRTVVQGLLSPTICTPTDRESNSPFAQSSWFFRFNTYDQTSPQTTSNYIDEDKVFLKGNTTTEGEIACLDVWCVDPLNWTVQNPSYSSSKYANWFFLNTKVATLHTPEIECADDSKANLDLSGTELIKVGEAYLTWETGSTVIDHFLETSSAGINAELSQVVRISRAIDYSNGLRQNSFCLYADSKQNKSNTEEVVGDLSELYGWAVYPWQGQGSLNNQSALNSKQKANGYTTRTALLKHNITARAHFAKTIFDVGTPSAISMNGCVPKIFNSDQLSGVSLVHTGVSSDLGESFIYYGNVDKIVTPDAGVYRRLAGWRVPSTQDPQNPKTLVELSQNSTYFGETGGTQTDPVSMKYKSSSHIVIDSSNVYFEDKECGYEYANGQLGRRRYREGLHIVELIRDNVSDDIKFGEISDITPNAWVKCGDSVPIPSEDDATVDLFYLQGDCYFQMYDCLKTYPYTQEDTNSIIEICSTMLETYVNLDFRYDNNRGASNNVAISPRNFNLFNDSAYNQSGNFFSYHQLDYNLVKDQHFPNTIVWTTEKHLGEDVDSWMSVDANNTEELDGAFGKINKVINYNNELYCFQNIGISQLLFNSRVQIPTSDGVPIEITNGMKMQGKRYISSSVGCTNKWSIVETPQGLYFNDDLLRSTYIFNGQLSDLSTAKGMKSWMNNVSTTETWNPKDFNNCKVFYDKPSRDIYWVYKDTALVYSEVIGQYVSFMDYGNIPLLKSFKDSSYAIPNSYRRKTNAEVNIPFQIAIGRIGMSILTISLSSTHTKYVQLQIKWATGSGPRSPMPAAIVYTDTSGIEDVVVITIYTCSTYDSDLYDLREIISTINSELPSFLSASLSISGPYPVAYRDSLMYDEVNTYLVNNTQSPLWEIGKGSYNMFFGVFKPYWITLISNSNPTLNKIYNNVAWRDIVGDLPYAPFKTFDHIRVWNEHQDTLSVNLVDKSGVSSSGDRISYDANASNLRKKFNVWRCQIPRNKYERARISSPWCYIKLSNENVDTHKHQIMDIEVDYFM